MTIQYICKKCDFTCFSKNDMKRHLTKKKRCIPFSLEKYTITDEENNIESMKPVYCYDEDVIKTGIKCDGCNKFFISEKNLTIHHKKYCKKISIETSVKSSINKIITEDPLKVENISVDNIINNNIDNIIDNSINIEKITINNVINFNPILNINLQDFNDEWKTDHISDIVKRVVFLCQNKFSNFLTEVLKNNENNNVVLDKNSVNGYVYNKDKMEFEVKEKDLIIEETVEKIKNHLIDLSNEVIQEPYSIELHDVKKAVRDIKSKYIKYKDSSKKQKKEINNIFSSIYDNNKIETLKNYDNIKKSNYLNM